MTDQNQLALNEGADAKTPSSSLPAVSDGVSQSSQFLAQIIEASRDPKVDPQNVETMANLAIKLQDRELQTEFNRAKVAAIMDMPVIKKNNAIVIAGKNGEPDRIQGRFVKYEDLQKVIKPILARHGLVINHNIGHNDHATTVQPILSHVNGVMEKGEFMSLPLDTSGGKNNTQGAGSSSEYGKRYTTVAMLNIVQEGIDNDGAGGGSGSYDNLDKDKRALVDAGRAAAVQGMEKYMEWFKGLDAARKGWLALEPYHDQNKKAADQADKH